MLPGGLFTFTAPVTSGNNIKACVTLNTLHPIFEGHFPGQPILPGVCMIQMVKQVTEAFLNKNILLISGQNLKFLSVIYPDKASIFEIELKIEAEDKSILVVAQLQDNEIVFFKFKGTFMLQ